MLLPCDVSYHTTPLQILLGSHHKKRYKQRVCIFWVHFYLWTFCKKYTFFVLLTWIVPYWSPEVKISYCGTSCMLAHGKVLKNSKKKCTLNKKNVVYVVSKYSSVVCFCFFKILKSTSCEKTWAGRQNVWVSWSLRTAANLAAWKLRNCPGVWICPDMFDSGGQWLSWRWKIWSRGPQLTVPGPVHGPLKRKKSC